MAVYSWLTNCVCRVQMNIYDPLRSHHPSHHDLSYEPTRSSGARTAKSNATNAGSSAANGLSSGQKSHLSEGSIGGIFVC